MKNDLPRNLQLPCFDIHTGVTIPKGAKFYENRIVWVPKSMFSIRIEYRRDLLNIFFTPKSGVSKPLC
ncbi:hypothetical protein HHX47_DHR3000811 [Lentinula edodes]|nr:hypothetical protein HHX47_DHR3000811 [Lentinula edodes]